MSFSSCRITWLVETMSVQVLEEFNFCNHPYSNASVDRAGTPNLSSK